jgi:hypothetical protein
MQPRSCRRQRRIGETGVALLEGSFHSRYRFRRHSDRSPCRISRLRRTAPLIAVKAHRSEVHAYACADTPEGGDLVEHDDSCM